MNYILTSIYDEKTKKYLFPQVDENNDTARRNFAFAMKRNDQLAFIKNDLRLYDIGTFDSDTGVIVVYPAELICDGKEFDLE